ncbi:MAG: hypothetical protein LBR36_04125 [Bacteroidales bacterium]|nr:hypothetical protein [Bacteroidales bacterium]
MIVFLFVFFAKFSVLFSQNQVGSLPGSIDVSPTGSATYSIPIEVVPGTQGIQPNLSIVYNSQSGNGALGLKWDISGLSAITRSGQNKYHDNNITAIQFNDNLDRFSLDGNRLIKTSNNGAYGSANSEYMTEIQTFTKTTIKLTADNKKYFEVEHDNGTIAEYGKTATSRLFSNNSAVWMLNKITDVYGNYMTYIYETDNNYAKNVYST